MVWLAVTVLAVAVTAVVSGDSEQPQTSIYTPGDPRVCLKSEKNMGMFEVLPGIGWDNLRNKNEGLVVGYNYSKCRTTEDGRFLIPDNVNTIPLKQSKVNIYSELITHWTNYTSSTAKGVNVDVGLTFSSAQISGKFSSGYENIKSKQIGDKSYTTRVQLRYVRYVAKLQPDAPLHPTFKSRLLEIAGHLELNETTQARYASELLVRDFGTHVITSVDAGAALVQVDGVSSEFVNSGKYSKSQITAGASASLFNILSFGASYTTTTTTQFLSEYQKQRTSSEITTLGGPLFKAENFTANDWTNDVDQDLVAVGRYGDPIFFLINAATLPELPKPLIYELYSTVQEAVKIYYEFNTYRGCTKMDSPNFSPVSNLDDGTCESPFTNLTFGGIYQTCSLHPGSNNGDLCSGKAEVNPKTGSASCPDGYESVELHTGKLSSSRSSHECHSCWLFFHCCHDNYYHSEASYTMYWCAARGPVPQDSGYLFGGLYTSQVSNPLTQDKSCPANFFPRVLGQDLHVCISDDYELGTKYSLPFGGFISCDTGNPLALEKKQQGSNSNTGQLSLKGFLQKSGNWPKHCPKGYSQHLAYVDQGCEINYCLQAGSLSGVALPTIRRPPFQSTPAAIPIKESSLIFNMDTHKWRKGEASLLYMSQLENSKEGDGTAKGSAGLSAGAAAVISVVATVVCIGLATVVVVTVKRRRNAAASNYRNLKDPLLSDRSNYGSNADIEATC